MLTQIDAHASVTLDSNGAGRVSLGPPSGTRWALDLANVSVVTAAGGTPTASSTCTLYRGSTSGPVQQVDVAQFTGNGAASGKVRGVPYFPGQVLWAVWSGGDAGAVATLQVYGQQGTRSDSPFESTPPGEGFPSIPNQIIVGDPNGPHIVIGQPLPPELTTFYTGSGFDDIVSGWIGFYITAADYFYIIAAGGSVNGDRILGMGVTIAGTVHEILKPRWFHSQNESALQTQPALVEIDASATLPFGGIRLGTLTGTDIVLGSLASLSAGNEIFLGGISHGAGIVDVGTATASVSGIGVTLTTVITTAGATYTNGRAFRLHVHIPLVTSVAAGDVVVRWIQVDGTIVRPQQTWWRTLAAGSIVPYDETLVFVNTSGADITDSIRIQIATTAGANIASSVSGTAPGRCEVEDIGPAANYPSAPSMA